MSDKSARTSDAYKFDRAEHFKLRDQPTDATGPFKHKDECIEQTERLLERLRDLQTQLYAERKHALLIVLQAIDAGGKDGAIRHVFSGVNPQGCSVTSFKQPSTLERSHDYLWRIHAAVPPKGMIGIFNRSHYESVLVERVDKLVPKKIWQRRYEQINQFEAMLASEGTTILKFYLHISKKEQKERLQARLDDPSKHWKFDPNDLVERRKWDEYIAAGQEMIRRCSTKTAPWIVVPADHKWFRNWMLADAIVRTMENLKMSWPKSPQA